MDFSNFWWSGAGGGPGPGPGATGQSLRFRGTAALDSPVITNGSTDQEWCISFWIKKGSQGAANGSLFQDNAGYPNGWWYSNGTSYDSYAAVTADVSSGVVYTQGTAVQRDYSAWYHIFLNRQTGSNTGECWINGVKYCDASTYWAAGSPINWRPYSSGTRDFYLADYHFVSGNHRAVTDFGTFNANGVWVPVDPGLTQAQYGADGWHLTFAADTIEDVGGILTCRDQSGNGNDHTMGGFDTVSYVGGYWVDNVNQATSGEVSNSQGQVYITDVVPDNAYFDYSRVASIQNLFDGDLSTYNYMVGVGEYGTGNVESLTFDLRDYNDLQSLELLTGGGSPNTDHSYTVELLDSSKTLIAGTQVKTSQAAYATPEWVSVPVSGTPRYMRLWSVPYTTDGIYKRLYWFAIRINGQILSQSAVTAATYDLMQDSPTNNFATFNPLDPFSDPLTDANLSLKAGTSTYGVAGTISLEGTGYYVELTCDQPPTNPPNRQYGIYFVPASGLTNANPVLSAGAYEIKVFAGTSFQIRTNNAAVVSGTLASAPAANFVIQAAYNAGTRQLYVCVDNTNWLRNDGTISNAFDAAEPTIVLPEPSSGHYTVGATVYNGTGSINHGQQPFRYAPPAGFEPLSTAKMPAPTIANGRDHFQAITGPGNAAGDIWKESTITSVNPTDPLALTTKLGPWNSTATYNVEPTASYTLVLAAAVNSLTWSLPSGFASGAYCYVSEDGITWRNFNPGNLYPPATNTPWPALTNFTVNDGTPIKYMRWMSYATPLNCGLQDPIGQGDLLSAAQATFPSGLWWIKDRANANQHQFVDIVRGQDANNDWQALRCPTVGAETDYVAPTGNSVAWCWSAPDTFTPTRDSGNINNLSGRRNVNAGFSIVEYNVTSASTFAFSHGLSQAPDFIISKTMGTGNQFYCYHSSLGVNQWVALDVYNSAATFTDFWAVNATNWGTGTSASGMAIAGEHITYLWHAVPGYSAFGSYTGNGSTTDGTFVYLGFRPAFVLYKRSNANSAWVIRDSTRSTYNPSVLELYPSTSEKEYAGSTAYALDFVSNGFKWRSNPATGNALNAPYIYAAFAENPFQSPVTAR